MTHFPELLACGIDPERYAIQLALCSPSQVYCNPSLPISAKEIATFRELVPSSAEAIIDGFCRGFWDHRTALFPGAGPGRVLLL
jgi:hypothetical protein